MKLISMHVDDFGGLHNYDYTFDEGLNVVLHDNGWGKTTMATFLKAMLYGYDTRRSKDITENERKRYLPWQGGKYGGYLDFESEGVQYRIYRTFGETPRFDSAKVIRLDTKTTARIPADKIGETLFHLDANAFQRSVFINQNGLSIDGAASSIHTRLNALVSQANDVAAYDGAIAKLTQQVKVYEKTGARGQLGDITKQITERERLRDQLERDIYAQDAARERIIQIDGLLSVIDKDLAEKNKKLDAVSGEGKKREAAQKMLDDLRKQIASIQQEMTAIETELGGQVPTGEEIDQIKRYEQTLISLRKRIGELEAAHEKYTLEYKAIVEAYDGALPTAAQLDEIQAVYGEIQGIISSGSAEVMDTHAPEEYELIKAAEERTPGYIKQLQAAVDSQSVIQKLTRQQDAQKRDIQSESESWASKTKRYKELKAEMASLEAELKAQEQYSATRLGPAIKGLEDYQKKQQNLTQKQAYVQAQIQRETASWNEKKKRFEELKQEAATLQAQLEQQGTFEDERIRLAIAKLEELQRKQQRVDEKKEYIPSISMTDKEKMLLAEYPGELPGPEEGNEILGRYRDTLRHQAAAQGLSARLDGERSKANSLTTSLAQLESVTGAHADAVEEPKKVSGAVMIGLGVAIIIAGAALGIVVNPMMAAIAVIGVLLIILGVSGKSTYQKKLQAYDAYMKASAQRQEADRQKEETRAQLTREAAEIAALEEQLSQHNQAIAENDQIVSAWIAQWGAAGSETSEPVIAGILDRAARVRRLREKKEEMDFVQKYINEQTSQIEADRESVDALYPEYAGKSVPEALGILRTGEMNYKITKDKLQSASRSLKKYISDAGLSEEQLSQEASPGIPELQGLLRTIVIDLVSAYRTRREMNVQYPEIVDLSYDDALKLLRDRQSAYQVTEIQYKTAERNYNRFIKDSGASPVDLELEQSPRMPMLTQACESTSKEIERRLNDANSPLSELDLDTDLEHILQALKEAAEYLNVYRQYDSKLKDKATRQRKKQEQLDALQRKQVGLLMEAHLPQKTEDLPVLLATTREAIGNAAQLQAKIVDLERDQEKQKQSLRVAEYTLKGFIDKYGHFEQEDGDMLIGIYDRAGIYSEKLAAREQLEKQAVSVENEHQSPAEGTAGAEEAALRTEVERLKERRDSLLIEYTQTSDAIRQSDSSLEKYPDLQQDIQGLYEQKQKVQNKLAILKRTIQLITRAKENLANRYLSKVEQLFNSYMQVWLNNDAIRGLLDINFNVSIEENNSVHVAEGYSTGYCDMIDFCMRLALVDTLFEKEQPFLILDDPFVNLDADRLEKALELLNVMAANKQIIYFVCHPIRAVETEENSASRAEFLKLAEATRRTTSSTKSEGSQRRTAVRKSPKEMYKITGLSTSLAFRPANPNYTITNNIFSMSFVLTESGVPKDCCYELFFIDAVGHVLNDRQLIEISNGKLSTQRVQFSLNTRDDSGNEFELMIRESGQDDYDVVARYPFRAKLAFTGTFNFDF